MSELLTRFGREFQKGEVLFREGETGDVMYVLHEGAVRITKNVGGDEKTIAVLGPGEFLGEMAILNNKPRTATATVIEDAICIVIDAWRLETMVSNNTEIALRLIKKLAKRLDSANALIEIVLHRDPKARVMLGLLRHAETYSERRPEGVVLRVKAEELSDEVGVDLPVVQAVLDRLRKLKLASEGPSGAIVVSDVDRLQDFLELLDMPQRVGREAGSPG